MRVINETSYPDGEVRALVRWGMRGLKGLDGVPVRVVPARTRCSGRAWWGWTRRDSRIVIRLAPEDCFPYPVWTRHRGGPATHDWQTWQEAVVALAAHEGRHLDLVHHGYPGLVNGRGNSVAVERNCEAFEHRRLQEYRSVPAGTTPKTATMIVQG